MLGRRLLLDAAAGSGGWVGAIDQVPPPDVPAPLSLGTVQLADGSAVHGFLCEPVALQGARDISASGGWRAHLATL